MTKMETLLLEVVIILDGHARPQSWQFTAKWFGNRNHAPVQIDPIVIRHKGHVVCGFQHFFPTSKMIRIPDIIRIEERYPVSRCDFNTGVAGCSGVAKSHT